MVGVNNEPPRQFQGRLLGASEANRRREQGKSELLAVVIRPSSGSTGVENLDKRVALVSRILPLEWSIATDEEVEKMNLTPEARSARQSGALLNNFGSPIPAGLNGQEADALRLGFLDGNLPSLQTLAVSMSIDPNAAHTVLKRAVLKLRGESEGDVGLPMRLKPKEDKLPPAPKKLF